MKEMMPTSEKEMSLQEQLRLLKNMQARNEERIKETEVMQALWMANVETLEEKVPHDDVMQEDKTLSYSVIRNHWLSMVDEAGELLVRLNKLQATLAEEIAGMEEEKALEALGPEELN